MSPLTTAFIILCAGATQAADTQKMPSSDVQRIAVDEDSGNNDSSGGKAADDKKKSDKDDMSGMPFDGFGQIAAEMEKVALKESAKLLHSNKATPKAGSKDCDEMTPDATKVAAARAQVSAVIAKAARPDLVARVSGITALLQQLEADLEMIRRQDSLTPATKALVELSLLKEREALLESVGLKPTEEEGITENSSDKSSKSQDPD